MLQFRRWFIPTLTVLVAAAVCVRLGIWQLDRLAQRREFNSHYMAQTSMEPLELPAVADLESMEYRRVIAQGVYDFSHQVALRNQYYEGQYGFRLITPLVLLDGSAVLVDRGWVPYQENSTRADWEKYSTNGVVTVSGIIRLKRDKADITGKSDPDLLPGEQELLIWNFPNITRIQEQTPYVLLPIYIQEAPMQAGESLPMAALPDVEISEGPHMGYALQWFAFAGIFLIGYPVFVRNHGGGHLEKPVKKDGAF
jgi:surfeit locus 1 family protein